MKISPRARLTITIILASFLFFYLSYVILIYAALKGGALTKLTEDSDDFKLEAKGGHSFWPGRVVLKDARLRFKDHNIEVAIEARELFIRASLFPILSKTIQIDEFVARDARYKMLHRVHDGHKNRERLAAFPDIGFKRPKVYDKPSPPYGVPPFKIRVEKIRGNALEAWILEYRAVGNFEALGGFELHEDVKVFPSRVTLREGTIFLGKKEVARNVECDLGAEIGPFPGKDPFEAVLDTTDGLIRCDMLMSDLYAFRAYFPDSEVGLAGTGKLSTDLKLTQGQLRSSSMHANLTIQHLGLEDAFLEGEASLSTRFDPKGHGQLGLEFAGREPKQSSLDLKKLSAQLELEQSKALEPSLEGAKVEIEGLGVRDPAFVRRLGMGEFPLMKLEQAKLDLAYLAKKGEERGKFDLDSEGAVAIFPKPNGSITCPYRITVRCELETEQSSCDGSKLECSPITVNDGPEISATIAAVLRADTFAFTNDSARTEWGISLGNPKDVLRATLAKDLWSSLGITLLPLGALQARARVNRRNQTIAGTVDSFEAGGISGKGGFLFANSFVSRWLINTPVARLGVDQTQSGTNIQPFAPSDWDVLAFGK